MTAPDDTWRELLRGLAPSQRLVLQTLPTRLGIASNGASWEFARLPPLVATPRFFDATGPTALRSHHRACFWGLTADRLADGEVTGVEPWELDLLHDAWRASLTTELGDEAAREVAARARTLQHEGFALESALLRRASISFEAWARCVLLRTAWFNASTLTALPLSARPAVERGLQHLMLGLQLLDDVVDAPDDLTRRGASWPALLGLTRDELLGRSLSFTLAAAHDFSSAGHRVLGDWCEARVHEVAAHFATPLVTAPSAWSAPTFWSEA